MDLKKIFGLGKEKVEDEISSAAIEKVIEEIAEKFNIKLPEDKVSKIVKTVTKKVNELDMDKIKPIVEKEIKKFIK